MEPQIPEECIKAMNVQNQNPVRVEKNSMQKNRDNDKTKSHNDKTRSYAVQLGSSTLVFSKINESPIPEPYKKQIIDQLCQMEQQKKIYHQLVTKESLLSSKDTVNQIRGGDLDKGSSPGARARNDARKATTNRAKDPNAAKSKPRGSSFAEAWSSNPSKRSRPAAANRLAQQFQTAPAEGGNGLFGRFSARPTPDPSNPGCAGGPRSITILSGQRNPNSSTEHSIREIIAHDGVKGKLTDKSTNHLTSKHGSALGIDDPLPPLPNQKPGKYAKIRTRINNQNKKQFMDTLEKILEDPNTEPFPDVNIRGIKGHGYLTDAYGKAGFFIGIHTEGEFAGQIKKAQPVTPEQLEDLRTLNSIN